MTVIYENFDNARAQSISEFIQRVAGAEVTSQLFGTGKIVSCLNVNNNFESLIFTVHFDLDETKNYGAAVALASGGLKFTDASLDDVWDDFVVEQYKLKAQYNKAAEDAQRRQKEELKKEKQKEAQEKKKAEAKKQGSEK